LGPRADSRDQVEMLAQAVDVWDLQASCGVLVEMLAQAVDVWDGTTPWELNLVESYAKFKTVIEKMLSTGVPAALNTKTRIIPLSLGASNR